MEWIAINQARSKTGPIHTRQEEKVRRPHQTIHGRKEERESANDLADLELRMFSFSMF